MRTTTPATFRIEINEYAIKCFLENHWNDYIIPTNLSINEEALFADTTSHFTSENRLRFFKEIPEIDQNCLLFDFGRTWNKLRKGSTWKTIGFSNRPA